MMVSGQAVRRLRQARRMTLAEVAAGMRKAGMRGTNPSFVAIAERDLWVNINEEWVLALADALDADLDLIAVIDPDLMQILAGGW